MRHRQPARDGAGGRRGASALIAGAELAAERRDLGHRGPDVGGAGGRDVLVEVVHVEIVVGEPLDAREGALGEQAVQVVSEFGCGRRGHGLTDSEPRPVGPQWGWPHFDHGQPAYRFRPFTRAIGARRVKRRTCDARGSARRGGTPWRTRVAVRIACSWLGRPVSGPTTCSPCAGSPRSAAPAAPPSAPSPPPRACRRTRGPCPRGMSRVSPSARTRDRPFDDRVHDAAEDLEVLVLERVQVRRRARAAGGVVGLHHQQLGRLADDADDLAGAGVGDRLGAHRQARPEAPLPSTRMPSRPTGAGPGRTPGSWAPRRWAAARRRSSSRGRRRASRGRSRASRRRRARRSSRRAGSPPSSPGGPPPRSTRRGR